MYPDTVSPTVNILYNHSPIIKTQNISIGASV